MKERKFSILRVLIVLIFISAILFVIISGILSRFLILFSLSNDYINSGQSFFIPSLPYINVFWFLPKEFQFIRFNVGHLIDIIIIINLDCYMDTCFYHYYKKAYLNEENQVLIGFNLYVSNNNYETDLRKEYFFPIQSQTLNYPIIDEKSNIFSNVFLKSTNQKLITNDFKFLKISSILRNNIKYIQFKNSFSFQIKKFINIKVMNLKYFPISPKNKYTRINSLLLFLKHIFIELRSLFFIYFSRKYQSFIYHENPFYILNQCKNYQITEYKRNNFNKSKIVN